MGVQEGETAAQIAKRKGYTSVLQAMGLKPEDVSSTVVKPKAKATGHSHSDEL